MNAPGRSASAPPPGPGTPGRRLHLLSFFLIAAVFLAGGFEAVEYRLMDARFVLLKRAAGSDLIIIDIDPRSLGQLSHWPWPRGYHAQLLRALDAAGVRQIAFDIDFSATSTTGQDEALRAAIAQARAPVVLAAFAQRAVAADGLARVVRSQPLEAFREHARLASINVRPEADALVRRMARTTPWGSANLPSMATRLTGSDSAAQALYYVDFALDPTSVPRISYVDVLEGRFDPARVAGKTAIVGATAIELGDQVPVPVYRSMPGPLLQALAYFTLLDGPLVRVEGWIVLAGLGALALVLGRCFGSCSWRAGALIVGLGGGVLFSAALAAQAGFGLLLDMVPWLASLFVGFAVQQICRIDLQAVQLLLQSVELRRKDEVMRHVVTQSFDGIVVCDADGKVSSANPAAARLFRQSPGRLETRSAMVLFPHLQPDDLRQSASGAVQPVHDADADADAVDTMLIETIAARPDGSSFPAELSISSIVLNARHMRTLFIRDISERKRQEDALRHQANHDALTDLPNRPALFSHLRAGLQACAHSERGLALLLLDLDRFKEINDTLGHHVGDRVLREVGQRLTALVADRGMVARLGGDEFAITLPEMDAAGTIRTLAEEIVATLRKPFEIEGLSLELGCSVGVARFPLHGQAPSELLQRADVAMYEAKRARASIAIYDARADRHSIRGLTLSGTLRRAIENGELELHYQPKVDLSSGLATGVEALVRWHHSEHGLVRPDEFIPMAEQTGLIHPLSLWTLDTALAQAARWRAQALPLGIAINLSPQLLQDRQLGRRVEDGLTRHDIDPELLTLEITEGALMSDPERALAAMAVLSAMGVRLSIDDFGTGYSSLAYLQRLPVDELKIDKSFVHDIASNSGNLTIVRSTIELAHAFGLRVVAEGIESQAVLETLARLDCNVGQGYLFGRPAPAVELERHLATSVWAASTAPAAVQAAS